METEELGWDGLHKEKRIALTRCRDGLLSYEPRRTNETCVVSRFITLKKKKNQEDLHACVFAFVPQCCDEVIHI